MRPPLKIVVPDEQRAVSLRRSLQPHYVETQAVDGHFEVRVALMRHNPESRIGSVLNAIDQWLQNADVPCVQIHLHGVPHTLHPTDDQPPPTAGTR
jgi:hypothetical protein